MSHFPVPEWQEPSLGGFGPRNVVRTIKAIALQHGLIFLFAMTLVVGGLSTNREVEQLRAFAEEGVPIQATLEEKYESQGSRDRHLLYYYRVGKILLDAEKRPSQYEYAASKLGDKALITYLPSDPSKYYWGKVDSEFVSASRTRLVFETVLVAILIQLGGLYARARIVKEWRILRDFVAAPGEIIDIREVVKEDKSVLYEMTFRTSLPDGRSLEFSKTYRREQSSLWNVGDKLVVLVDPDEKDGPYPLFEITLVKANVPTGHNAPN